MKLVHPDFFVPIEFRENRIETIVIEKPEILSDMIVQLKSHVDGPADYGWVLSDNNKLLDMAKVCDIIIDPFAVDINNKRLQNALWEILETEINSTEKLFEWNDLCGKITQVMERFLTQIDFQVTYSDKILVKDFLKLLKVRFQEDDIDFVDKLLDFLRLEHEVLKIKLFVLVNIKGYLTIEQLNFLYQQSCYEKYQLLLLESQVDNQKRIGGEHLLIIDNDSCVIS